MATAKFDPNRLSFERCTERVQEAVRSSGLRTEGRIVTSRDTNVDEAMKALVVDNAPPGFRKWQLPVWLDKPSHLFITAAEPGAQSSTHSHDDGDGIRFIVSGSITYDGQELTAGDWMFIPAGVSYSFETGRFGALMCYCYCCCCA
ncbi:cupin domain-containing protein [Streptomyces sp. NPDC048604]|uniref:cupin domain-containing protein n=1 Tax=Streptomyces sp. NPDC048604 TaxID=3365578 RepID=UPI00371395B4